MWWIICESCPWCRINHFTCWPAVQHSITVLRVPPYKRESETMKIYRLSIHPSMWIGLNLRQYLNRQYIFRSTIIITMQDYHYIRHITLAVHIHNQHGQTNYLWYIYSIGILCNLTNDFLVESMTWYWLSQTDDDPLRRTIWLCGLQLINRRNKPISNTYINPDL